MVSIQHQLKSHILKRESFTHHPTMKRTTLSLLVIVFSLIHILAAGVGKRHVESAGGFSYCPPEGWEVREFPGMKYKLSIGQAVDGFAANINVVDEAHTGSLKDYVKANVHTLSKVFQGFKNLGQTDFKTDSGRKGFKLVTESEQQGKRLRQSFFFFEGKDGKKLVVTCSAAAADGSKLDSVFEASLKTFAIEK